MQSAAAAPTPTFVPSPGSGVAGVASASWRTWQTDGDKPQRVAIFKQILEFFKQRKRNGSKDWQQKLPDLVRRMEEELYRSARSKEEYADATTLEQRLQMIARRMANRPQTGQPGQVPSDMTTQTAASTQPSSAGAVAPINGQALAVSAASAQCAVRPSGTPDYRQLGNLGAAVQPKLNGMTNGAPGAAGNNVVFVNNGVMMSGATMPNGTLASTAGRPVSQQLQRGGQGTAPNMSMTNGASTGVSMFIPTPGIGQDSHASMGPQSALLSSAAQSLGTSGQQDWGATPALASGGLPALAQPGTSQHAGTQLLSPQQQQQLLKRQQLLQQQQRLQQQQQQQRPQQQQQRPMQPHLLQQAQQNAAQQLQRTGSAQRPASGKQPAAQAALQAQQVIQQQQQLQQQQRQLLLQQQQQQRQQQQQLPGSAPAASAQAPSTLPDGSATQEQMLEQKKLLIRKQQQWLLFLRHASKCQLPEGTCQVTPHCVMGRKLWLHVLGCKDPQCAYPRCLPSRELLGHHQRCRDARCPVCGPVKEAIRQRQAQAQAAAGVAAVPGSILPGASSMPASILPAAGTDNFATTNRAASPATVATTSNGTALQCMVATTSSMNTNSLQPPAKRVKLEEPTAAMANGNMPLQAAKVEPQPKASSWTSLVQTWTADQIRVHLRSLRGNRNVKVKDLTENQCRACLQEKLYFEPPPLYCTSCGIRVKRNAVYYITITNGGENKHIFCNQCFCDIKSDSIELDGQLVPRSSMEKRKNDEPMEEPWVQCDRCEAWQHQICALFNSRRNESGGGQHLCPDCCLDYLESKQRTPIRTGLPKGPHELPRTHLSEFLEHHLRESLRQERLQRAQALGKPESEVSTAEGLTLRVVSCTDKRMEVKSRFLERYGAQGFPREFPYRSKVVLLFQKIDGVDICLFGMYTQEFGSDAAAPNTRRVYLSYLDSVKYFQPEVRTVAGEALRTFVYHDVLVGYVHYMKMRGFFSIYIWACPPLKGEDYILYCHPEQQKTPKADKLREWYLQMLHKSREQRVVVQCSNLFDTFFVGGKDGLPASATELPYFDGDYWPGAAEEMVLQVDEEQKEEAKRKVQKKGKSKKASSTKRSAPKGNVVQVPDDATPDQLLMVKMGEAIQPMKEDFILVHLQHFCAHCRRYITSGNIWSCQECKDFHLCTKCQVEEQDRSPRDRHPRGSDVCHSFMGVEAPSIPPDTIDRDGIMMCEFFDTRQAFLSLCQGNHYQFDMQRRAKHSSMMVLYHLHNPTAPAFVASCNICQSEIEIGRGWRCETCPDFDMCNHCKEVHKHPHPLIPAPQLQEKSSTDKDAEQRKRIMQRTVELLQHVANCLDDKCSNMNCHKVKQLLQHFQQCKTRVSGGCPLCRKMLHFLQLHVRSCTNSSCHMPRCRELKDHLRKAQSREDDRRRAAANAMARRGDNATA